MHVLVTGASGYLGLHIIKHLLESGYTVKGSARGDKFKRLKRAFSNVQAFEAVEIPDVGSGDLSPLLKGIDVIIHTAAPLGGRVSFEESVRFAAEGGVHIIREGYKAGVRRAIVTSSIATFPNAAHNGPYGHEDFADITVEKAKEMPGHYGAYVYQKTHADHAVVAFAEAHPDLDVILLAPTWILGPQTPEFTKIIPTRNVQALASHAFFLSIVGDGKFLPWAPGSVDVRDVARVHVRAIRAPPATGTNWRRYVIASPNPFSWKDAIQIIHERRPELRARLIDPAGAPDWPERENRIILSKEEADEQNALFGVKQAGIEGESGKLEDLWEYRAFEETVLDGIDSIIEIERVWDQAA